MYFIRSTFDVIDHVHLIERQNEKFIINKQIAWYFLTLVPSISSSHPMRIKYTHCCFYVLWNLPQALIPTVVNIVSPNSGKPPNDENTQKRNFPRLNLNHGSQQKIYLFRPTFFFVVSIFLAKSHITKMNLYWNSLPFFYIRSIVTY